MRCMRAFEEIAVIAIHEGKKMRSNLDDRGKTCFYVGYSDDHSRDVYRFLDIRTKRIIISRDVRWLNIIWKHYRKKSIYARKHVELFWTKNKSHWRMKEISVKAPLKKKRENIKVMEITLKQKRS